MVDRNAEETVVVQTYTNRSDAEIAKSYLHDNGIDAFVTADDVHVPIQMIDGARLFVMSNQSERALSLLREARLDAKGFMPDDASPGDGDEDHG